MASANGSGAVTVDLAADEVPEGEVGTAVDSYDRIFTRERGEELFAVTDVQPRDIDNMLRQDGKARKLEQVLTLPLQSVSSAIEPVEGDRGEAEFVREALLRPANAGGMSTSLSLVIAQMTAAVLYRKVFFEKVFKAEEGRILYDKLAWRPPGTCALKRHAVTGAFQGFTQRVPDDHPKADKEGRVTIPPERAFVLINGKHRDPLRGASDLDTAYQLWTLKQKVRFLYFTFLENQVMPKAIATHSNSDPAEIQKFARKVSTLKGGGVIGIAPDQDVAAYENSTSAGETFESAINLLNAEIADSVLAGFSELSSNASGQGRGSFALAKSDTDLFLQSRQAVLDNMASDFTGFVIADLVRWNFGTGSVPKLTFGPLVREHAETAIELLKEFAGKESPNVPAEFIEELIVKVSSLLGIDEAKVAEAFRARTPAGADPLAQMRSGVEAATTMVREAGLAPV